MYAIICSIVHLLQICFTLALKHNYLRSIKLSWENHGWIGPLPCTGHWRLVYTVHPIKYGHGAVMLSVIVVTSLPMNSCHLSPHILQGCFTGTVVNSLICTILIIMGCTLPRISSKHSVWIVWLYWLLRTIIMSPLAFMLHIRKTILTALAFSTWVCSAKMTFIQHSFWYNLVTYEMIFQTQCRKRVLVMLEKYLGHINWIIYMSLMYQIECY